MPKTKNRKSARVKDLTNVIIPDPPLPPAFYPWTIPGCVDRKVILELGCGKGEHSLAFATAAPESLCVGVDCKSHRLCTGGEKGLALGLENLFYLRIQIEEIRTFFPDHSIHEIWLTFPDPHPKQRSIKHRLSSAKFLEIYSRLLIPGGTVHLKTDSDLFYTYTRKCVAYWGGQIKASSNNLHGEDNTFTGAADIVSAFEEKALTRGETIKYLSFTLS